ncbi:amidase, partial [Thiotrichales bacterium HSG1]|nr:amidase [Thiotrichales bacterium HSG1]
MHTKTLTELSLGLRQREYSSVELTQYFLDRIAKYDNKLNSFITVTEDIALAEAKAADKRIANGEADILTGIPLAHKDLFCTNGVRTSCGSKMLDNFIAPYDATVVAKCKAAGMVMLGKTNMDEFAMGSSNETSFYGSVKNPWNMNTVPGGSSGGSVAAVAAGLVPIATGTDTGGSIRQPSALCGVIGLKPTYGAVSRYGMIAFASSLDQGGPITHNAEDAALLLNVMSGFDKRDSTSMQRELPDHTANLNNNIKGLKIGLIKEYFNENLDTEVSEALNKSIKDLEQAGAVFQEISLPHSHLSVPIYYIFPLENVSSIFSNFSELLFGLLLYNLQYLLVLISRS